MAENMTAENFTYWLQGFMELTDGQSRPTEQQWKMIREHLNLVFDKVTPDMEFPKPQFKPRRDKRVC